jgi:hypothetical protein
MNTPTMPQNPLLAAASDPDANRILQGPTSELAQATRPPFFHNDHSPVQWASRDWEEMEENREDLFDMAKVRAQFDRDRFLLDGYAVFEGIVLPKAIEAWTAALQYGQHLNDTLLQADWSEIDWYGLGRTPPEEKLAAEAIDQALGESQSVPQETDTAGVRTLRQHSVFAEYFPAGHIPFIMNVLTHPHMFSLQRMCIGCDAIYFDHNQLLSRRGGYAGGTWHSHKLGHRYDGHGVATTAEYDTQANAILTLCYLNGFNAENDGGLKIIRGSHLFRDPTGCRAESDEKMRQGWMKDRIHPVKGEPLGIEHLSLPPGSVVCCLSHAAHAVAEKSPGKKTRWCSLFCYRKPDTNDGYAQPPTSVPPVWAMKASRGELPSPLTELLRPSFDLELTGGRTSYVD